MIIDVRIPYEINGQLGIAYNRIMNETKYEWVLFLDHDIMFLHPSWYQVFLTLIEKYGKNTGIFTCKTNNTGCKKQLSIDAPSINASLLQHKSYAKNLWQKNQYRCTEIKEKFFAGFCLLTSKKVWEKVGGFRGKGLFAEDYYYYNKVINAGLKCLCAEGLYCFHLRDRSDEPWIEGILTSNDYWKERKARQNK